MVATCSLQRCTSPTSFLQPVRLAEEYRNVPICYLVGLSDQFLAYMCPNIAISFVHSMFRVYRTTPKCINLLISGAVGSRLHGDVQKHCYFLCFFNVFEYTEMYQLVDSWCCRITFARGCAKTLLFPLFFQRFSITSKCTRRGGTGLADIFIVSLVA